MNYKFVYKDSDEDVFINLQRKEQKVKDFKKDISERLSIDPGIIVLVYENVTLGDDKSMDDYEVENGRVISIKMRIIVVSLGNDQDQKCKEEEFIMNYGDRVKDLRSRYCTRNNAEEVRINIGRLCKDEDFLRQYFTKMGYVFWVFKSLKFEVVDKRGGIHEERIFEDDFVHCLEKKLSARGIFTLGRDKLMIHNTILNDKEQFYTLREKRLWIGFGIKVNRKGQVLGNYLVNFHTKISRLKTLLAEKYGLDDIILKYKNQSLSEDQEVGYYGIKDGSVLEMAQEGEESFSKVSKTEEGLSNSKESFMEVVPSRVKEYFKITLTIEDETLDGDPSPGLLGPRTRTRPLSVSIDPDSSVEELRRAISETLGRGLCGVDILYSGKILRDGPLRKYNLKNKGHVVLRSRHDLGREVGGPRVIHIRKGLDRNETQRLMIVDLQTIGGLKEVLRDQYDVNVNRIHLRSLGREFQDQEVILDLDLEDGHSMDLLLDEDPGLLGERRRIDVRLEVSLDSGEDGLGQTISVYEDETIESVKKKVDELLSISSRTSVMSYRGVIMKTSNLVRTYDVKDGDHILITGSVLVNYFSGFDASSRKVQRYIYKMEDTVGDLMSRISRRINMEPRNINLSFNGEVLQEDWVLRERGVQNESYILMRTWLPLKT